MEVGPFGYFYQLVPDSERMSLVACVDWCIGAMERGTLPVCLKSSRECYLWDDCVLTASQWDRICRLRPPLCELWNSNSFILLTPHAGVNQFTSRHPDAITALVQIEYLWTDLRAVDRFLNTRSNRIISMRVEWIADEVDQRRRWAAGLRRAWLAAVVGVHSKAL